MPVPGGPFFSGNYLPAIFFEETHFHGAYAREYASLVVTPLTVRPLFPRKSPPSPESFLVLVRPLLWVRSWDSSFVGDSCLFFFCHYCIVLPSFCLPCRLPGSDPAGAWSSVLPCLACEKGLPLLQAFFSRLVASSVRSVNDERGSLSLSLR